MPCPITPKHGGNGRAEHCSRDYRDDIDMFGVYCTETRKVYLVPVSEVPTSQGASRVTPSRNGQVTGIRWAAQYELHPPE